MSKNTKRRAYVITGYSLLIICMILFSGCKFGKSKNTLPERVDNFSEMGGYLFTDNYAYVVDLAKNSLAAKIRLPSRPTDIYMTGGSIFFNGDYLFKFAAGKINKVIRLTGDYRQAYKTDDEIYLLKKTSVTGLSSGYTVSLSEEPIKFSVEFDRIWVLDGNGLSVYNAPSPEGTMTGNKEINRIPVDEAVDFILAPYGIRVYIAKKGFIDVFDTQGFNFITHISIKGTPKLLRFSPSTDKIYCVTEADPSSKDAMLYIINRGLNKTEQILRMENITDLVLSRDGSYGVIVSDSTVHFLNSFSNKVVKKLDLRAIDVTTSLGDSRVYCVTSEELVTIEAENFEPTSRVKIEKGRKMFVVSSSVAEVESVANRFFVIQVDVGSKDSVPKFIDLLKRNYYPAWGFEFAEGNKVRVGFFRKREDADLFKIKIDTLVSPHSVEIVEAPMDSNITLDIKGRDINKNGFVDEAIQIEGKTIIIFEFQKGAYTEIYRCSKEDLTYTGQPEIKEVDNKLVAATPLVNGAYSIIEYCARDTSSTGEDTFMERTKR